MSATSKWYLVTYYTLMRGVSLVQYLHTQERTLIVVPYLHFLLPQRHRVRSEDRYRAGGAPLDKWIVSGNLALLTS